MAEDVPVPTGLLATNSLPFESEEISSSLSKLFLLEMQRVYNT